MRVESTGAWNFDYGSHEQYRFAAASHNQNFDPWWPFLYTFFAIKKV